MIEAGQNEAIFAQALDYIDSLYGYAITLSHDQAEAEDLVQETYLRAAKACGQLVPGSNVKGWLFVIMRNVWLNQVRHTRSGPRFIDLEVNEDDSARLPDRRNDDPHAIYIRKLEREEVQAAIDSLPRHYREIVLLRDVEGFSYKEIATMLGCPAGTVMSRLGRARDRLRKLLAASNGRKAARAV